MGRSVHFAIGGKCEFAACASRIRGFGETGHSGGNWCSYFSTLPQVGSVPNLTNAAQRTNVRYAHIAKFLVRPEKAIRSINEHRVATFRMWARLALNQLVPTSNTSDRVSQHPPDCAPRDWRDLDNRNGVRRSNSSPAYQINVKLKPVLCCEHLWRTRRDHPYGKCEAIRKRP